MLRQTAECATQLKEQVTLHPWPVIIGYLYCAEGTNIVFVIHLSVSGNVMFVYEVRVLQNRILKFVWLQSLVISKLGCRTFSQVIVRSTSSQIDIICNNSAQVV